MTEENVGRFQFNIEFNFRIKGPFSLTIASGTRCFSQGLLVRKASLDLMNQFLHPWKFGGVGRALGSVSLATIVSARMEPVAA